MAGVKGVVSGPLEAAQASLLLFAQLLLLPLPLDQHREKLPQVKVGPQALEEDDGSVLVTLPEHKVTQTLDPRRADEQVQRRGIRRHHVVRQGLRADRLRVEIGRVVGRLVSLRRIHDGGGRGRAAVVGVGRVLGTMCSGGLRRVRLFGAAVGVVGVVVLVVVVVAHLLSNVLGNM